MCLYLQLTGSVRKKPALIESTVDLGGGGFELGGRFYCSTCTTDMSGAGPDLHSRLARPTCTVDLPTCAADLQLKKAVLASTSNKNNMEIAGFEPAASCLQSRRATTALNPLGHCAATVLYEGGASAILKRIAELKYSFSVSETRLGTCGQPMPSSRLGRMHRHFMRSVLRPVTPRSHRGATAASGGSARRLDESARVTLWVCTNVQAAGAPPQKAKETL